MSSGGLEEDTFEYVRREEKGWRSDGRTWEGRVGRERGCRSRECGGRHRRELVRQLIVSFGVRLSQYRLLTRMTVMRVGIASFEIFGVRCERSGHR